MSGTDLGYDATNRCAMPGTDLGYATTRLPLGPCYRPLCRYCPALSSYACPTRCPVLLKAVLLRTPYAESSTERAYGAMRIRVRSAMFPY
eukprot:2053969-Rhodomonas_salina.1